MCRFLTMSNLPIYVGFFVIFVVLYGVIIGFISMAVCNSLLSSSVREDYGNLPAVYWQSETTFYGVERCLYRIICLLCFISK
jgi:hypothetical protein